jgi:hypothetical protein
MHMRYAPSSHVQLFLRLVTMAAVEKCQLSLNHTPGSFEERSETEPLATATLLARQ